MTLPLGAHWCEALSIVMSKTYIDIVCEKSGEKNAVMLK
jgi:hypothetical protein